MPVKVKNTVTLEVDTRVCYWLWGANASIKIRRETSQSRSRDTPGAVTMDARGHLHGDNRWDRTRSGRLIRCDGGGKSETSVCVLGPGGKSQPNGIIPLNHKFSCFKAYSTFGKHNKILLQLFRSPSDLTGKLVQRRGKCPDAKLMSLAADSYLSKNNQKTIVTLHRHPVSIDGGRLSCC